MTWGMFMLRLTFRILPRYPGIVILETDRTNYCSGWTVNTGTSLLVNLGTALPASGSYTATVSAVVAQTADPSMLEGLPTAQVEMAQPFATDAYGVSVPVMTAEHRCRQHPGRYCIL